MNRREALRSLGAMTASVTVAPYLGADEIRNFPQSTQLDGEFIPTPSHVGGLQVLNDDARRRTLAAAFDRLIPGDELGPSATEAGCIEFLDGQLAGPWGEGATMYRETPLQPHAEELTQAPQFIATPRERYETGLDALNDWTRDNDGAEFAELAPERQDQILSDMEQGNIDLGQGVHTQAFFEMMLVSVREGYFSDPIYGGNRDMAGWKLIGFPGARYDYRLYADHTGEKLDLIPVSLIPQD
ncbi:gluconate 2-dehydrogenase subunit 3 family protein [Halomonas sp. HNIBRBA4712]|uniref:gluconate 2-dehydrogenase subunit 3 family protein n=1 Tax=Halomonas sp. HNIBRBA4712 TaxID=3373087 RepID=UPI0037474B2E